MLAIPDLPKRILRVLLAALLATLVSCASQKDARLVNDPDQKSESAIPWNKQEKWETEGPWGMANMINSR